MHAQDSVNVRCEREKKNSKKMHNGCRTGWISPPLMAAPNIINMHGVKSMDKY